MRANVCVTGFEPHPSNGTLPDAYHQTEILGERATALRPEIIDWLSANQWQESYSLWQASRRCGESLRDPLTESVCSRVDQSSASSPVHSSASGAGQPWGSNRGRCSGSEDGYAFLAMHRHLLQSLNSLWPQLKSQLAPWDKFPGAEDYPLPDRGQLYAWPDAVQRAAETADAIGRMSREEVLARWPDEGAFGQWLQCGATQAGMAVNSVYGALITNGLPLSGQAVSDPINRLELYLFWNAHGWVDKVWDKYRKAIGKTPYDPELQAALIEQCQQQSFWSAQTPPAAQRAAKLDGPLYRDGDLNPDFGRELVRLLGEVVEIKTAVDGQRFYRLDLRLVGVKPVWVSSFVPVVDTAIEISDRYVFLGQVRAAASLDPSGRLQSLLQSPALLMAESIQSPK